MNRSKASDYFVAGIILIVLAGFIWLLETCVLNIKVDNIILLIIPSVFLMLSIAHLISAGTKWVSSG